MEGLYREGQQTNNYVQVEEATENSGVAIRTVATENSNMDYLSEEGQIAGDYGGINDNIQGLGSNINPESGNIVGEVKQRDENVIVDEDRPSQLDIPPNAWSMLLATLQENHRESMGNSKKILESQKRINRETQENLSKVLQESRRVRRESQEKLLAEMQNWGKSLTEISLKSKEMDGDRPTLQSISQVSANMIVTPVIHKTQVMVDQVVSSESNPKKQLDHQAGKVDAGLERVSDELLNKLAETRIINKKLEEKFDNKMAELEKKINDRINHKIQVVEEKVSNSESKPNKQVGEVKVGLEHSSNEVEMNSKKLEENVNNKISELENKVSEKVGLITKEIISKELEDIRINAPTYEGVGLLGGNVQSPTNYSGSYTEGLGNGNDNGCRTQIENASLHRTENMIIPPINPVANDGRVNLSLSVGGDYILPKVKEIGLKMKPDNYSTSLDKFFGVRLIPPQCRMLIINHTLEGKAREWEDHTIERKYSYVQFKSLPWARFWNESERTQWRNYLYSNQAPRLGNILISNYVVKKTRFTRVLNPNMLHKEVIRTIAFYYSTDVDNLFLMSDLPNSDTTLELLFCFEMKAHRGKAAEQYSGMGSGQAYRPIEQNREADYHTEYPDIASSKRLRCRLGLDKGNDCPIDGVWSQWKAWGKCTGECGQVGHRTRQRICNNPPPSQDGSQCQGTRTETESCVLQGCTEDEYKKLAAGNPLRSKQFDAMKAVHHEFPVLVGKCLTNDCRYDLVQQLIHDQTKAMVYWNALHCVKYDMGCPVRGGWTPWNAWSPCTAVCGQGIKYRLRNCTKPPPSSKELFCRGNNFENKSCSGIACAPRQDGVWTSWGQWSLCSSPCGPGTRYRVRECVKKPDKRSVETANISGDGEDALMNLRLARELDVTNMCAGPNREDQFCHNKDCSVDGQWSNWESWSPCSTECGIGAHFRSRSCSSPPPQGSGKMCPGLVSEVKHCFERPCAVKTHVVAVLNGGGSLLYTSTGHPCRLLHMYIRFFPTSAYGMLIYRYHESCMGLGCDYISLALEDNFLVLAAQVSGCIATTISTIKISNGQWHDVMFTVTGVEITLRVDDSPDRSYSSYNCDPVLPNLDQAMRVGERFQGKIQRMSVNFSPVMLRNEAKKGLKDYHIGAAPYGTSSVVYEVGDSEEGYVKLVGKEMITIPCPSNPNQWQVELAVKPDKDNGILLYIPGSTEGDYILATLESGHIRLRYKFGMDQSSAEAQVGAVPGKWLSLYVSREAGEEGTEGEDLGMSVNGESRVSLSTLEDNTTNELLTCDGDIMVGDITYAVEKLLGSESSAIVTEPLIGTLGFLAMDGVPEDIETLPMEQERGSKFSSRTASFSDSYEEITLLLGQQLNLTCMYGGAHVKESLVKKKDMSRRAVWLHLDVPVNLEASNNPETASYTVQDDGHATHLKVSAYPTKKSLEGFFLCWSHLRSGGAGKVLVAYGVSLVDPAVEFSSTSIEGMTVVKILSILVLIIYCFILCMQAFTSRNNKYGPFGSTMRRIRGDEISEEEKFMAMLELIRSPQGRLILGSDDAVQESEERLSKAMRLHGGEDVLRTYNSRDNLNISDADLPPLPDRPRRRHKSFTVLKSNAESGYRSLRRKLIKSKSAPKTHDPKREWLLCDDMGSMTFTTVTKANYHSTPQTNKHIELSTFAPEASRKMYNARVDSGSTKYPIRTYNASKEDGVLAKSKISTNIKHSDYIMETMNMNLTKPLRYEINKSDEEYEYNLLTLLPEPKNSPVPKEQAKSETLQQPFLGVTREKSPTKKVKMLFDEVIKKTEQTTLNYQIISENTKTESVDRKLFSENRRTINSQHKSDQGTQTLTDIKESTMKKMYEEKKNISPDGIHKNITEGAGACQKIKLARKPAELELNYESSNKGLLLSSSENVSNLILGKKTLEERKVYIKKSHESTKSKTQIKEKDDKEIKMTDVSILSGIKWKKRKIKTKKRPQKKGESKCNPLLASVNDATHVSTESTQLVPTPAKISEHFLNLDETVKDVLKECT